MKIFIDFDDVLFNTKKFKEDYFKIFKKRGVSKKVFKECYFDPLDSRDIKNYDPTSHIKRVCGKIKIDASTLKKEIENFTADTRKYVLFDVMDFLDKFEKKDLNIISFSITDFQKAKVYNSGLIKFFDKVKIVNSLMVRLRQPHMQITDVLDQQIEIRHARGALARQFQEVFLALRAGWHCCSKRHWTLDIS
jgi:FMN phosphatase YigB (HAD superfamily)